MNELCGLKSGHQFRNLTVGLLNGIVARKGVRCTSRNVGSA